MVTLGSQHRLLTPESCLLYPETPERVLATTLQRSAPPAADSVSPMPTLLLPSGTLQNLCFHRLKQSQLQIHTLEYCFYFIPRGFPVREMMYLHQFTEATTILPLGGGVSPQKLLKQLK